MVHPVPPRPEVVIVGAGPAGLIAADCLSQAGVSVTIVDQMPSPARKFLMAGRGGLNLTHSEPKASFLARYGRDDNIVTHAVSAFPPPALVAWCEGLGEPTFIGSSGRVFPTKFKASPLLRAILRRLESRSVRLLLRSRFAGWSENGALRVITPEGEQHLSPSAALLAMGGATWPRLGTDAHWVPTLQARGISVSPLSPFNAGVLIQWSEILRRRFSGSPIKPLMLTIGSQTWRGEAVLTQEGLEGGIIYAASACFESASKDHPLEIALDLAPDLSLDALIQRLDKSRKGQTQTTRLARAGLKPASIALLREAGSLPIESRPLAILIKSLPFHVTGTASFERAISTSGGVSLAELDDHFMVKAIPGLYVAGEMLDWQAPTGGYLLQASFATGLSAARGILQQLDLPVLDWPVPDWL